MPVCLELGKTGIEIIFQRPPQQNSIRSRMIRSKHVARKSVKPYRIIVGPGNRQAESLSELLQIDQRRPRIDADRLPTEKQFSRMARRARDSQHHIFLSRVRVGKAIVTRESNRQPIRIQQSDRVRDKAEALHVGIVPERRRAGDGEPRLLQRQKPRVGQQLASLRRVVILATLIFRPVLRKPLNILRPINLRNFQTVVYRENRNPYRTESKRGQCHQHADHTRTPQQRPLRRWRNWPRMIRSRCEFARGKRIRDSLLRQILRPVSRDSANSILDTLMNMNAIENLSRPPQVESDPVLPLLLLPLSSHRIRVDLWPQLGNPPPLIEGFVLILRKRVGSHVR